jgi:flagellar protein FlaG
MSMNISTQLPLDPVRTTSPSQHGTEPAASPKSAVDVGGAGGNQIQQLQVAEAAKAVDEAAKAKEEREKAEQDPSELDDVVKNLNEHIQQYRRELQFKVDNDSGRTVVKVMDVENDEVIRQIPSEEVLALSKRLSELTGTVFQEKA